MNTQNLKDYLMKKREPEEDKKQIPQKKLKREMKSSFNPNQHLSSLFDRLDEESDRIYYQPWNRLEKGVKLDRLLDYVTRLKTDEWTSDIETNNRNFIESLYHKQEFNKLSDVTYDSERGEINQLTKVIYNEKTCLLEFK